LMTVLVALAWTATALADDPGLVDQYTEQVPTASGSSGGGGGSTHSTPLPGNVRTQIYTSGGSDAKTLEKVATSSRYGAPTIRPGLEGGLLAASSPGPLSAAVSAVSEGSDTRLIALFIALVVVAAIALGAAAARRARQSDTS